MIIHISLVAGTPNEATSQVEVETATTIDTADPRWATSLVDMVTGQAQEGARQLVAQLTPQLPGHSTTFVPLADVAPLIAD
jgi:hypothetical protein